MGLAREGLELATIALEQLQALEADSHVIANAIRERGMAYWTAGDSAQALPVFRKALEHFKTLDDTFGVGVCHHEIGICLETQGNIGGANHHFRQALRIWESLGNANDLANTLNSLGVSLCSIGYYDEALNYFNDSLDIALKIQATRRIAFAQAGIGDVYLQRRGFAQAINAYESSTKFAREVGVRPLEIYNLVKLGECFFQQHDFAHALKLANQAREIAAEGGLMYETGLACALLARIHTRHEKYTASHEFSSQAVSSFADNDVLERAKARLWWAYSLLLHQRPFAAREQLQEAVRLALNMGELIRGLGSTVGETRRMLLHFLHWPDTPEGMRESIRLLLAQAPSQLCISSPDLQVYLLGNPYLAITGRVRQFRSRGGIRKTPEFLAYLLIEGRADGCRRNEVSSRIWPDLPPRRALQVFHQTLSRLRQMLFQPTDYVVVQDDHYRVNPNYLSWCDASIFDHMYERIGQASPDEILDLRLELISLSRGEFLRGFDLGVWGTTRRSRYERRFLRTIRLASEQLLTMNELHQALVILQKGLDRDALREDLHRSLMRVYAKLGLYDHVKLQYLDLCDVLREELGVRPDQRTTHLYQTLTRHPHAGRP
jgi:DNA-binding SARP family transcriptional activator/Tfp pilus assembly protein PilF